MTEDQRWHFRYLVAQLDALMDRSKKRRPRNGRSEASRMRQRESTKKSRVFLSREQKRLGLCTVPYCKNTPAKMKGSFCATHLEKNRTYSRAYYKKQRNVLTATLASQ